MTAANTTGGDYQGSVCPHDCPSTCALEVEVLRDDDRHRARHRHRPRRRGQQLHRRRDLREGRPLRRARAPPGPPAAPAAADRPQGLRPVQGDRLRGGAGPRRRGLHGAHRAVRLGDRLALLLCRHHGPGAAGRHPPAPPRHALFRPAQHHLHRAVREPAGSPASAATAGPTRARWRRPTSSSCGAATRWRRRST